MTNISLEQIKNMSVKKVRGMIEVEILEVNGNKTNIDLTLDDAMELMEQISLALNIEKEVTIETKQIVNVKPISTAEFLQWHQARRSM
jgi:hypothetical protein